MSTPISPIARFFFDEPTPEQKRYLRKLLLPLVLFAHIVWACSWLPLIGIPLPGFAQASDLDKHIAAAVKATDDKIEAVSKEQAATRKALKNIETMLLENLMESTSAKIRAQVARRCKTEGRIEREEINREIDRLQKQYKTYSNGEKYDEPTCNEI